MSSEAPVGETAFRPLPNTTSLPRTSLARPTIQCLFSGIFPSCVGWLSLAHPVVILFSLAGQVRKRPESACPQEV